MYGEEVLTDKPEEVRESLDKKGNQNHQTLSIFHLDDKVTEWIKNKSLKETEK